MAGFNVNKTGYIRSRNPRAFRPGMTLTELLVATMLVAIVMVGAVSVDFAIRSSRASSSAYALISMQANTLMSYMVQDAMLAVGTDLDRGFDVYNSGGNNVFCFRQDFNDPSSFADDKWICYWHGNSMGISRCNGPDPADFPIISVPKCTSGGGIVDYDAPFEVLDGIFAQVIDDANGRFKYVEISFRTKPDPASATYDPIMNPEISLSTRISPPGHSH